MRKIGRVPADIFFSRVYSTLIKPCALISLEIKQKMILHVPNLQMVGGFADEEH